LRVCLGTWVSIDGLKRPNEPRMKRARSWALGILAAIAILAGAARTGFASAERSLEPSFRVQTLVVYPGFGLVATTERPPALPDYTIASLMRLATPWPIERLPTEMHVVAKAQSPVIAKAEPSASAGTAPIARANKKTSLRSKTKAQVPQQKTSWLIPDWWRGLLWLRIR
jgi:hypothetical protein